LFREGENNMHDDESSRRPTLEKAHLKEKVNAQERYNCLNYMNIYYCPARH